MTCNLLDYKVLLVTFLCFTKLSQSSHRLFSPVKFFTKKVQNFSYERRGNKLQSFEIIAHYPKSLL